jgi:DNA polymerase III sliding clamp (beta) subunit (PCNA family)
MKIQTTELKEILKALQPGIAQRSLIEQAKHYIFTGKNICSYNDRISISYPFPSDFQCSVSADEFYQVTSKLTSKELELELVDNQLLVSGPKVKSGFTSISEGNLFSLLESLGIDKITNWIPLPKDFIDGLKLCLFSASRDQTQKILSSICIRNRFIETSDDLRISSYSMEEGIPDGFLLPTSSVAELIGYKVTDYSLETDGWIHFKINTGGIFSSRVILEEFPETQSFLKVEGFNFSLPSELLQVVETVGVLSEGDFDLDKRIEICIKRRNIICKSSKDSGWIEKRISFDYKGEELTFSANPIFLKQILEKTTQVTLAEDRALFTSGSFSHVMALP